MTRNICFDTTWRADGQVSTFRPLCQFARPLADGRNRRYLLPSQRTRTGRVRSKAWLYAEMFPYTSSTFIGTLGVEIRRQSSDHVLSLHDISVITLNFHFSCGYKGWVSVYNYCCLNQLVPRISSGAELVHCRDIRLCLEACIRYEVDRAKQVLAIHDICLREERVLDLTSW